LTVLSETPIAAAIAGCAKPSSRSNTIRIRWRCFSGMLPSSVAATSLFRALLSKVVPTWWIYVAGQTTNPSLSRLRITLGGVVFVDSAGGTLSAVDISGRGDGGAAIVVGMQATPRLRSWAGIGNLAAIHPIGAGDDATLHRLPEHLGETDHWHGAGTRNDYRPTLVRVRLSVEIALSLKTKAIALIGGRRAEPLSFSALLLAINSR
jgi:hypothetical protein